MCLTGIQLVIFKLPEVKNSSTFSLGRTTRYRSGGRKSAETARSAPLPPAQGDEADVEAETIECMLFYTHLYNSNFAGSNRNS